MSAFGGKADMKRKGPFCGRRGINHPDDVVALQRPARGQRLDIAGEQRGVWHGLLSPHWRREGRSLRQQISIETARSKMELLDAFITYRYPNEIGPGVYDIHAPRCPSVDEMAALLDKAKQRLSPDQIWVNPDCGLKTRKWEEVRPALINMVHAARRIRGTAQ